jgi:diaminopimelate epimerase
MTKFSANSPLSRPPALNSDIALHSADEGHGINARVSTVLSCGSAQMVVCPSTSFSLAQRDCIVQKLFHSDAPDGIAVVEWEQEDNIVPFTPNGNKPALCINAAMAAAHDFFDSFGGDIVNFTMANTKYHCVSLGQGNSEERRILFSDFEAQAVKPSDIFTIPMQKIIDQCNLLFNDISHFATIDVGTPQLYITATEFDDKKLTALGNALNVEGVTKNGVNVTIVSPPRTGLIIARTFERGGAGLTNSCASASAAAVLAVLVNDKRNFCEKMAVQTMGGVFHVYTDATSETTVRLQIDAATKCVFRSWREFPFDEILANR